MANKKKRSIRKTSKRKSRTKKSSSTKYNSNPPVSKFLLIALAIFTVIGGLFAYNQLTLKQPEIYSLENKCKKAEEKCIEACEKKCNKKYDTKEEKRACRKECKTGMDKCKHAYEDCMNTQGEGKGDACMSNCLQSNNCPKLNDGSYANSDCFHYCENHCGNEEKGDCIGQNQPCSNTKPCCAPNVCDDEYQRCKPYTPPTQAPNPSQANTQPNTTQPTSYPVNQPSLGSGQNSIVSCMVNCISSYSLTDCFERCRNF